MKSIWLTIIKLAVIRLNEIVNWNTISPFLNQAFDLLDLRLPLKARMGLKADKTREGYDPANNPIIIVVSINKGASTRYSEAETGSSIPNCSLK